MLERRSLPRNRCYLGGVVEFDGRSTLDVVVRDISRDGARLVCSQNAILPDNILLAITKRDQRFPARIVWHRRDQFGICFTKDQSGAFE